MFGWAFSEKPICATESYTKARHTEQGSKREMPFVNEGAKQKVRSQLSTESSVRGHEIGLKLAELAVNI
jgi:hypothetical protein